MDFRVDAWGLRQGQGVGKQGPLGKPIRLTIKQLFWTSFMDKFLMTNLKGNY